MFRNAMFFLYGVTSYILFMCICVGSLDKHPGDSPRLQFGCAALALLVAVSLDRYDRKANA